MDLFFQHVLVKSFSGSQVKLCLFIDFEVGFVLLESVCDSVTMAHCGCTGALRRIALRRDVLHLIVSQSQSHSFTVPQPQFPQSRRATAAARQPHSFRVSQPRSPAVSQFRGPTIPQSHIAAVLQCPSFSKLAIHEKK